MKENTTAALPQYVCHKTTGAARIVSITPPAEAWDRQYTLALALPDGAFFERRVISDYMLRFHPEPGGWFLQAGSGPAGYASAEAFARDYSAVPNPVQVRNLAHLEHLLSRRTDPNADLVTLTVAA